MRVLIDIVSTIRAFRFIDARSVYKGVGYGVAIYDVIDCRRWAVSSVRGDVGLRVSEELCYYSLLIVGDYDGWSANVIVVGANLRVFVTCCVPVGVVKVCQFVCIASI